MFPRVPARSMAIMMRVLKGLVTRLPLLVSLIVYLKNTQIIVKLIFNVTLLITRLL